MLRIFQQIVGNHTLFEAAKKEQLRFDCGGASGSRVRPFRNANKSEEKTTCESKRTYDADFLRQAAWRISPKYYKISPLAHRSFWPNYSRETTDFFGICGGGEGPDTMGG